MTTITCHICPTTYTVPTHLTDRARALHDRTIHPPAPLRCRHDWQPWAPTHYLWRRPTVDAIDYTCAKCGRQKTRFVIAG